MRSQYRCTVLLTVTAIICVFLSVLLVGNRHPTANDPDIDLTTVELIVKYGYPAETHTIVTEDGYILTVHRIPYGKKSSSKTNRPPVLVQHGLGGSSVHWILMGPEKGLGYILADAGYDVWLGNSRGNSFSIKHVTLDPTSDKFWNFSWHEMGVYDLPTVIDHILQTTGQEKLFYIGHSMGMAMFTAMASEKPEYNEKLRLVIGLAPAVYMTHTTSPPFRIFAAAGKKIEWFLSLLGIYQFLPQTSLMTVIGRVFCSDGIITQSICIDILFRIGGYNRKEFNASILPLILGHTPAGAGIKTMVQYGQIVNSGEFERYNYGKEENLLVYDSPTPPKYVLSKITVPVAIIYGQNDITTVPQDVATTKKMLPNVIAYRKVKDEEFNHFDFIWGIHVRSLVYDDVLNLMSKY